VVVQVKRIVDMGAYVSLLEYDGREGMMLLSELSKRRIRSVAKLLRVGRTEICLVLRADNDKQYVDLSKRRVEPSDARLKEEQFARAKCVHGIMGHVAKLNSIPVEELCNKVSWPLYTKYEDAYEGMRLHVSGELNLWDTLDFSEPGLDLSDKKDKIKEDMDLCMKRRLIQSMLRMRAKVDVTCSKFEGIVAIKEALMAGFGASKEECEVKIKLIGHPTFMLSCTTRDKMLANTILDDAMTRIEQVIVEKGGEFAIKSRPELIGQDEDELKDGEESDSNSSDSGSSNQDETMGDLDEEQMKELMAKEVEGGDDDDEDEKPQEKKGKKDKLT